MVACGICPLLPLDSIPQCQPGGAVGEDHGVAVQFILYRQPNALGLDQILALAADLANRTKSVKLKVVPSSAMLRLSRLPPAPTLESALRLQAGG